MGLTQINFVSFSNKSEAFKILTFL